MSPTAKQVAKSFKMIGKKPRQGADVRKSKKNTENKKTKQQANSHNSSPADLEKGATPDDVPNIEKETEKDKTNSTAGPDVALMGPQQLLLRAKLAELGERKKKLDAQRTPSRRSTSTERESKQTVLFPLFYTVTKKFIRKFKSSHYAYYYFKNILLKVDCPRRAFHFVKRAPCQFLPAIAAKAR